MMAELTETLWGKHYPPRSIHPPTRSEAHQQVATGIKGIDEAKPGTGHLVFLFGVLHGKGDKDVAVDILHIEGGKAGWNAGISESTGRQWEQVEVCIKDLHATVVKV